jgi:hypothetical protein
MSERNDKFLQNVNGWDNLEETIWESCAKMEGEHSSRSEINIVW